jgi:hypothetical protein
MPTPLQQVEQNLSEIAVAKISEKNPNLLNHYLGFDIIDKNDDGTRAAGIMGFKLGGQLIYIPVFFLNGKVKGMEVMYLKNSDTFVANNEQWVNYLSGQNPEDIGEPAKQSPIVDGETSNTLRIFSRPPASANSKAASLENFYDISVDDFIDTEIALSHTDSDLIDFLQKSGKENYDNFIKCALETPEIFSYISKFYDLDDLKITFESNKEASQENAKEAIMLVKSSDALLKLSNLSTEEKTEIIKNGYRIEDNREEKDKSDLYLGDYRKEFGQVTETGLYDILNHNGDIVKAMVFVSARSITTSSNDQSMHSMGKAYSPQVVVNPDNGNMEWAKQPVYYKSNSGTTQELTKEEKDEILKGTGKDLNSCVVGKKYFLVDHELSVYGPFNVTNKITENKKTTVLVEQDYVPFSNSNFLTDGGNSSCLSSGCCGHCWGSKGYLRLIDKDHGLPEFTKGNVVFVPKCCKVIEVKTPEFDSSKINDIKPGDDKTLQSLLIGRGAGEILVEKSAAFDINVFVDGSSLSFRDKSEVVVDLMSRAGLEQRDSEKVASEIFEKSKARVSGWYLPRVNKKLAFPSFETPDGAAGVNRDGTPVQTQQQLRTQMTESSPGPRPATDMDIGLWNQITDEDLKFLERASDSNSRQVFDPAMIGVIVRTSRSQSIVQEYIPELVDNLDRMCRLLLLFYWHNSDFAEEYGIDEMADFEDLILSTIKSTAKVVLFLKQRAVESSATGTDVLQ